MTPPQPFPATGK